MSRGRLSKEPFFHTETTDSSSPGIVLRRPGWATFAAQTRQDADECGSCWVDVDVEAIRSKLLQQATDAEAPADLLECLRSARVFNNHLLMNAGDRVRSDSLLQHKLLTLCPERLRSKVLCRRHLVLAARLANELDRARGLWRTEVETGAEASEQKQQLGTGGSAAADEEMPITADKSVDSPGGMYGGVVSACLCPIL